MFAVRLGQTGDVDKQSAVAALGRAVLRRRTTLGLSQKDIWDAGGPSDTTLSTWEKGTSASMPWKSTLMKLDGVLRWAPGSAAAVLAGGEPTELDEPASAAASSSSAEEPVAVEVAVDAGGDVVVPAAALDGLTDLERDEVRSAARERALQRAREIRATRPLPPEWALAARRVTDRPGHGAAHQWDAVGEESQANPYEED